MLNLDSIEWKVQPMMPVSSVFVQLYHNTNSI